MTRSTLGKNLEVIVLPAGPDQSVNYGVKTYNWELINIDFLLVLTGNPVIAT